MCVSSELYYEADSAAVERKAPQWQSVLTETYGAAVGHYEDDLRSLLSPASVSVLLESVKCFFKANSSFICLIWFELLLGELQTEVSPLCVSSLPPDLCVSFI